MVLSSQTSERGLLSFLLSSRLHQLGAAHISHRRGLRPRRVVAPPPGEQGAALVPGGEAEAHALSQPRRRRPEFARRRRRLGALSCMAGQLLADTYLSARDFVKEVSYTLTALARNQLKMTRHEVPSADVPAKFASAQDLLS